MTALRPAQPRDDAADAAVLDRAAAILRARSARPGGFWLETICRLLERTAAKIRAQSAPMAGSLDGYQVTVADAALMRAMVDARFAPDDTITLPSGKTVTGAAMRRWLSEHPRRRGDRP